MTHIAVPAGTRGATAVRASRMPPWLRLGIIFGVVSTASILLWGPIGVSGTYPRVVGWLAHFVAPAWTASHPYLVRMGSVLKPETFLVIGLFIGGFLASRGTVRAPAYETVHARETSTRRRSLDAFWGGVLLVFGARLAGGCTSGHIISGVTQLSLSSMLFAAATFGSGILTARRIHRGGEA